MIEKNARAASDDFFKAFIKEAHRELTKKPEMQTPSQQLTALQKLSSVRDVNIFTPVEQHLAPVVPVSRKEKKPEITQASPGTIEIPLVGIPVSVNLLGIFLIALACILGGGYFLMKIHNLQSEIHQIDRSFQELEDRLIFLQTFASHLALNYSADSSSVTRDWGYWRESYAMDWCLTEWQDQVELLQATLSETLGEVSNVLRVTSHKQLGQSDSEFSVISSRHLENLQDHSLNYAKVCFLMISKLSSREISSSF
jgi:hypothetical protein